MGRIASCPICGRELNLSDIPTIARAEMRIHIERCKKESLAKKK